MKLVMHVEDDEDIRDILQLCFDMSEVFDVVQCEHGAAALEVCESIEPDLLLLDYMMPGMSGKQLLWELRRRPAYRDIPAIFLTALAEQDERDAMLAAGAIAVITKPFDPLTVCQDIEHALKASGLHPHPL